MRTLEESIGGRCKHFNGIREEGRKCEAGVVYMSVMSQDPQKVGFARIPCFREGAEVPCEKREFPTPEEVAFEVAEVKARSEQLGRCIDAASQDAKKRGLKKGNGGQASVKCPVCESGTLHYRVASYNGHIWGQCSTVNCVQWMQ